MVLLTSLSKALPPADRAPFAAILSKPVRSADLRRTVMRAVAGGTGRTADRPVDVVGLRILMAEDNLVNQTVGRLILNKAGHQVHMVDNGEQAVEAAAATPFDVVLMDIHMPVMDGLTAAHAIRALGVAAHQPHIVALTAAVTTEDRKACLAAGMDSFLSKPIRAHELAAVLAGITPHPTRQPEAGVTAEPPTPLTASGLDRERLDGLDDLGDGLKATILAQWLDQARGHLTAVHSAISRGDSDGVAFLAHHLRGSSATIGANTLATTCAQIETHSRAGTFITNQQLQRLTADLADTADLVHIEMSQPAAHTLLSGSNDSHTRTHAELH